VFVVWYRRCYIRIIPMKMRGLEGAEWVFACYLYCSLVLVLRLFHIRPPIQTFTRLSFQFYSLCVGIQSGLPKFHIFCSNILVPPGRRERPAKTCYFQVFQKQYLKIHLHSTPHRSSVRNPGSLRLLFPASFFLPSLMTLLKGLEGLN